MKFQHLILPGLLWLMVGVCISFFVPTSPLVVGSVIALISLATYFSLRFFTHSKLPIVVTCCVSLFLLSSVLTGFNLINLLLICAIGTLVVVLLK
ncbi:MAG: hypothetical protein V1922_05670 [bacterium]